MLASPSLYRDPKTYHQKEFMKTRVVSIIFILGTMLTTATFAADKPQAAASTNAPTVSATSTNGADVVARVNGKAITRKELDNAVQDINLRMARSGRPIPAAQQGEVRRAMMEKLINMNVLLEEGNKHVPADIDKTVSNEVTQIVTRVGGDDQFKKMLAADSLSMDDFKKQVRDDVLIRIVVEGSVSNQVKVTPEEIKDYYDKNPDRFKQPESVRASHILIMVPADATDLVKTQKLAQIKSVQALLKHGDKFGDVAKKFSEDTTTAPNGGDLGYFYRGQMVPEFDTVAFSLKTNELSDVVTTQFGYHVILVTDRKPAQTVPF